MNARGGTVQAPLASAEEAVATWGGALAPPHLAPGWRRGAAVY